VAAALAVLVGPAGASGQGVDQTCLLPLTKFDPATVNVAYPDQAAVYYSGGVRSRQTERTTGFDSRNCLQPSFSNAALPA
jgi:hypothetical protein